jgi:hypothetical protein
MFTYDPLPVLAAIPATIVALVADDDADRTRQRAVDAGSVRRVDDGRDPIRVVSLGPVGHNLMRYRPSEVRDAIRSLVGSRIGGH